jgi:hypothetical protein
LAIFTRVEDQKAVTRLFNEVVTASNADRSYSDIVVDFLSKVMFEAKSKSASQSVKVNVLLLLREQLAYLVEAASKPPATELSSRVLGLLLQMAAWFADLSTLAAISLAKLLTKTMAALSSVQRSSLTNSINKNLKGLDCRNPRLLLNTINHYLVLESLQNPDFCSEQISSPLKNGRAS